MNPPRWPRNWSFDPRKVSFYLLDEAHVEGGAKARFFKRFGFDGAPSELVSALLAHPTRQTFVAEIVSGRGDRKLIFEGRIATPDGRNPRVRTVWRIDGALTAHFVTAVPLT